MKRTYTLAEIARLFAVTEKAVRDWVNEGMPAVARGERGGRRKRTELDLEAVVRWYFTTKAGSRELEAERARLAREQADRIAMENAERRGELAPISVIAKKFGDAVAHTQALLLAIPTKEAPMLAPLTDANAIHARLTKAIHDALHELSRYGKRASAKRRKN